MKKVLIVGAGPAGMMAACAAADAGAQVTLLERNEKVGRKLGLTGKGRCNVTNDAPLEEYFSQIISNPRFLYSALYGFTNQDLKEFLEKAGVPLKVERGLRVFPRSDHARDVIDGMFRALRARHVQLVCGRRVHGIEKQEDGTFQVKTQTCVRNGGRGSDTGGQTRTESWKADAVILATGGLSYPATGSTGDGYELASALGHQVVEPRAALVGLCSEGKWIHDAQGLSLKNVELKLLDTQKHKSISEGFGEMLFTHFGISGPLVLTASSLLQKWLRCSGHTLPVQAVLDLKPALDEKKLEERLLREIEQSPLRQADHLLRSLLPEKLVGPVLAISQVPETQKACEISKKQRQALAGTLKRLPFTVTGLRPVDEAIITMGGVNVREIDPATCQSRLCPGLYFAGELIDVDATTGGFNLQIAFSTGALAGKSAAICEKEE